MSVITVKQKFELAKKGVQPAVLQGFVDLGMQEDTMFNPGTFKRQAVLSFELVNDLVTDGEDKGKPKVVNKFVNIAVGPRATYHKILNAVMRKQLNVTEASKIDTSDLIGKNVNLFIEHKAKADGTVNHSIAQIVESEATNTLVREPLVFNTEKPDEDSYNKVSNGLKKLIALDPNAMKNKLSPLGE